jgi:hypothetical protein
MFIHSFIHSFICSFIYFLFIYLVIYLFIHLSIHLYIYLFMYLFIYLFITIGFGTLWPRCSYTLIIEPSVPHINSWEPCYFTKFPDGPQPYTLNVLWLQQKAAQIHMSERSQGFTITQNMDRGFTLCSTPPTQ